jgi:hypothetical protein
VDRSLTEFEDWPLEARQTSSVLNSNSWKASRDTPSWLLKSEERERNSEGSRAGRQAGRQGVYAINDKIKKGHEVIAGIMSMVGEAWRLNWEGKFSPLIPTSLQLRTSFDSVEPSCGWVGVVRLRRRKQTG